MQTTTFGVKYLMNWARICKAQGDSLERCLAMWGEDDGRCHALLTLGYLTAVEERR